MLANLHELVAEKKRNLQKWASTLTAKVEESQSKLNECELKVTKPTKIHELEPRIEKITSIAKEVQNVEVITSEHDAIRNNEIRVLLAKANLIGSIKGFGSVSSGVVSVLLSLTDNTDASVSVKWKLNGPLSESADDENSKLKIEWSEVKSDDLAEFDEKWQHQTEKNVVGSEDENTLKVAVGNKKAVYVIRILYFDGKNWSIPSEMKTVSIEQVMDSWDPQCKGTDMVISGTSIKNSISGYRSAYCKNVVSEGIHSWTFKIDQITSSWFLLGVFKSECDPILQNYFQSNPQASYCLELRGGTLPSLTRSGCSHEDSNKRNYGPQCNSGDVVKMTLDLVSCTLSYIINGKEHGKAWDVEKSSYRAACTMYGSGDKITSLSYESNV